jgi:hypothetical protein
LKDHGATDYYNEAVSYLKEKGIAVPGDAPKSPPPCGCPGMQVRDLAPAEDDAGSDTPLAVGGPPRASHLRTWPVQLTLVPPVAPFLKNADILIAADCVPFAFPDFHEELLKGRILLIGCPKLDDGGAYVEKLAAVFEGNDVNSVTVAHMEVPCCFGFVQIVKEAISRSGKVVPFAEVTLGVKGGIVSRE